MSSSKDRKSELESRLGPEIAGVYCHLYDSLVFTKLEWRIFSEWYRASGERIEVLNLVSGVTALIIQRSIFEGVILKICRMTDVHRSGRNVNASIAGLSSLPSAADDKKLGVLVGNAISTAAIARKWRNKKLAHTDQAELRNPSPDLRVTYEKIDACLTALDEALAHFASVYLDTSVIFDSSSSNSSDEVFFLKCLKLGYDYHRESVGEARRLALAGEREKSRLLIKSLYWSEERTYHRF